MINRFKNISLRHQCHQVSKLLMIILAISLSACASKPYDYSALKESKPRSILVIPPLNNTVEVNAPYTLLSSITKPLAEKGYYVFPVSVMDTFFKENGLPTTAEMNNIPLSKINELIGPDAILYIEIEDWGQQYQLISSHTIVSSVWRLIDAKTGKQLWAVRARAVQSSGDGGGGLAGAVIGALVDQIAGSISDRTPELSKQASELAVNNRYSGLLPGPYFPVKEKEQARDENEAKQIDLAKNSSTQETLGLNTNGAQTISTETSSTDTGSSDTKSPESNNPESNIVPEEPVTTEPN